MTYEEMSNFTHEELSVFTHYQLELDKFIILKQYKNQDMELSETVTKKLQSLCDEALSEYSGQISADSERLSIPRRIKEVVPFVYHFLRIAKLLGIDFSKVIPHIQSILSDVIESFK